MCRAFPFLGFSYWFDLCTIQPGLWVNAHSIKDLETHPEDLLHSWSFASWHKLSLAAFLASWNPNFPVSWWSCFSVHPYLWLGPPVTLCSGEASLLPVLQRSRTQTFPSPSLCFLFFLFLSSYICWNFTFSQNTNSDFSLVAFSLFSLSFLPQIWSPTLSSISLSRSLVFLKESYFNSVTSTALSS